MPLRRQQKIALAAFALGSGLLGLSVFRGGSGSACRLVPYNQATTTAPVPRELPNWSLRGLDGLTHNLEDFASELTIVAFWATWCPNCTPELVTLSDLYSEHATDGLSVIGISLDGATRDERVQRYSENAALPFPIFLTDKQDQADLSAIRAVPTLLAYDSRGQLVGHFEGQTSKSELIAFVRTQLTTVR